MVIKSQRKRKAFSVEANQVPMKSKTSQDETKLFLLYDRESRRDRDIIERLTSTLRRDDPRVKCLFLSDGTSGFVLGCYGEELARADKIIALLSSDFIHSEEAIFAFEMARSMCMERRENNIIIASKSCRKLPKAYVGFPKIKLSEKTWIGDLVLEIHKPVTQVSANSWRHNKEGYKCMNVEELYRGSERNTSTSLPDLDVLHHPPTLPKAMVEQIMIWNRFRHGPKNLSGVRRTESQKMKQSSVPSHLAHVKKTSSVRMDLETAEFIHNACIRRRRSGRRSSRSSSGFNSTHLENNQHPTTRNASCFSRPSSGVSISNLANMSSDCPSSRPSSGVSITKLADMSSDCPSPPVSPQWTLGSIESHFDHLGLCRDRANEAKPENSENKVNGKLCDPEYQFVGIGDLGQESASKKKRMSPCVIKCTTKTKGNQREGKKGRGQNIGKKEKLNKCTQIKTYIQPKRNVFQFDEVPGKQLAVRIDSSPTFQILDDIRNVGRCCEITFKVNLGLEQSFNFDRDQNADQTKSFNQTEDDSGFDTINYDEDACKDIVDIEPSRTSLIVENAPDEKKSDLKKDSGLHIIESEVNEHKKEVHIDSPRLRSDEKNPLSLSQRTEDSGFDTMKSVNNDFKTDVHFEATKRCERRPSKNWSVSLCEPDEDSAESWNSSGASNLKRTLSSPCTCLVTNVDEFEFDSALDKTPQDFSRVKFSISWCGVLVERGETVWVLNSEKPPTEKPMASHVRKRNGQVLRIKGILLTPLDNTDMFDK